MHGRGPDASGLTDGQWSNAKGLSTAASQNPAYLKAETIEDIGPKCSRGVAEPFSGAGS